MVTILLPALALGLIFISAFFSAMETAFFSLHPALLRRLQRHAPPHPGDPASGSRQEAVARVAALQADPRRLASALIFAGALANLPLVFLSIYLLREWARWPFWACALLLFAVVFLICDLLPKKAALRAPLRVAAAGARILNALLPLLDPVCQRLQSACEWFARLAAPQAPPPGRRPLDAEELESLVELCASGGALQNAEKETLVALLRLAGKTARDCMTPRPEMFALPDDLTNGAARERLRSRRLRRVPVYADTPDNILGVLDVGAFLLAPGPHYTELLTPPSFVAETMSAANLLRSFLTHPQRIAIVVDEFGGTAGLVALPDLVEEVIAEAMPSADERLYIEKAGGANGGQTLLVAGTARLDDLGEATGVPLEAEGIDTIGGLVFTRLGRLPKPGERLEISDLTLTVRRVSPKRVRELLVQFPPRPEEPEEGVEPDSEENDGANPAHGKEPAP